MDVKIIFPDLREISFSRGITASEAVKAWKKETLSHIAAVKLNKTPVDLSRPVQEDSKLDLIELSSKEGLVDITPQHIPCHGPGCTGGFPGGKSEHRSFH